MTEVTNRIFLDTNVLVYAYDSRDDTKSHRAAELIGSVVNAAGVISTQVVAEFCNVMLTGRGVTMKPADVRQVIDTVLTPMIAHTPDARFYDRAVTLYDRYRLSFYDALIIQAAIDLECSVLYSEDLQAGQTFGTLTIVNPFADEC